MNIVDWVENSTLGLWMADSLWAYPIVLATHAVGMSIVVGTIVMIDLRVLGFASRVPFKSFGKILLVCWFCVALNTLSGVALFTVDPEHFIFHPVFWTKIGLVIAGLFFIYLLLRELRVSAPGDPESTEPSRKARLIATLSLLFWLGAIIAGRLIAYIESG
jgi:hypothetical protein